jgi:type II secretion system protein G
VPNETNSCTPPTCSARLHADGSAVGAGDPGDSRNIGRGQFLGDLSAFEGQIDIYQLDVGSYPTTQQGLAALRVAPPDLPDPTKWLGPYARKDIPPDPWSNQYYYEQLSPTQYRVYSAGPDGTTNTADDIIFVSG